MTDNRVLADANTENTDRRISHIPLKVGKIQRRKRMNKWTNIRDAKGSDILKKGLQHPVLQRSQRKENEWSHLKLANRSFSRAVLVEWLRERAYCSWFKRKIGNFIKNTLCRRSLLMTERREVGEKKRWRILSLILSFPSQEEKWTSAYW